MKIIRFGFFEKWVLSILPSEWFMRGSSETKCARNWTINWLTAVESCDVKIWASVCSTEVADYLQSSLDRLHQWSLDWLLPVNKEKYAVLSIGHALSPRAYHLGGYLLRNSVFEKDLGVIVSPDLKTSLNTSRKVAAATKVLHSAGAPFLV